jgi:hypothetical protein
LRRAGDDFLGIAPEGWRALGIGLAIAALCMWFTLPGTVFAYLGVLVHELGHTLAGWLFGYPSIPAFDFTYGGGVTAHQQRSVLVLLCAYGGLAALVYAARQDRRTLGAALGLVVLFALLAHTRWHQALILAAGHGAELLVAMLFFYRALSGHAILNPLERPLYAALGFYLALHNVQLGWSLASSWYEREVYAQAKGGAHQMDFSRLASEHLRISLAGVARLHVLASLAALPLVFLGYTRRNSIAVLIRR